MSAPIIPTSGETIIETDICDELQGSYLDYAMSVLVARALPDVRDGLKPVHRRILYAMHESGYTSDKPHRKSARIVGDVMGKYHPHGDSSIYDAMVRLAQDFSMSVPLIDGQGNFGSMDGDPAAAMRYTESRLAEAASLLIDEIDRSTVDFMNNYDESEKEPVVLPAHYPNILVNGAEGIAVGMATKIPPHNPTEAIDAALYRLENPDASLADLMSRLPGPDLPTGGIIVGKSGIEEAYRTGKGTFSIIAKHTVEALSRNRRGLVFTEMPYQVNKAKLTEHIGEIIRDKLIDGITGVKDESGRDGLRLVIELRADVKPDVVLAQLHRQTNLRISYGISLIALNRGRPEQMSLIGMLDAFLAFRKQIVRRRTAHDLRKARDRAHIVAGLLLALDSIDKIVQLIRSAPNPQAAIQALVDAKLSLRGVADLLDRLGQRPEGRKDAATCHLTETQARSIMEMRLQRLTGLERGKLESEARELAATMEKLDTILKNKEVLQEVVRTELLAVRQRLNTPRRTQIVEAGAVVEAPREVQAIPAQVTLNRSGLIKREAPSSRKRRNKSEADPAIACVDTETTARLVIITERGRAFGINVVDVPEPTADGRGRPAASLARIESGELPVALLVLPDGDVPDDRIVVFASASGRVRRTRLADIASIGSAGKIILPLDDTQDRLICASICSDADELLAVSRSGFGLRFGCDEVRVFGGLGAAGVAAIDLKEQDKLAMLAVLSPEPPLSPLKKAKAPAPRRLLLATTSGRTASLDPTSLKVGRRASRGAQLLKEGEIAGGVVSRDDYRLVGFSPKWRVITLPEAAEEGWSDASDISVPFVIPVLS